MFFRHNTFYICQDCFFPIVLFPAFRSTSSLLHYVKKPRQRRGFLTNCAEPVRFFFCLFSSAKQEIAAAKAGGCVRLWKKPGAGRKSVTRGARAGLLSFLITAASPYSASSLGRRNTPRGGERRACGHVPPYQAFQKYAFPLAAVFLSAPRRTGGAPSTGQYLRMTWTARRTSQTSAGRYSPRQGPGSSPCSPLSMAAVPAPGGLPAGGPGRTRRDCGPLSPRSAPGRFVSPASIFKEAPI